MLLMIYFVTILAELLCFICVCVCVNNNSQTTATVDCEEGGLDATLHSIIVSYVSLLLPHLGKTATLSRFVYLLRAKRVLDD